MTMKTPDVFL